MNVQQNPLYIYNLSFSLLGTISAFTGDPLLMRNVCRHDGQMLPGGSIDGACIEMLDDIRASDSEDWRRQCLSPNHLYLLEPVDNQSSADRFREVVKVIYRCFPWYVQKEMLSLGRGAGILCSHLQNDQDDTNTSVSSRSVSLKDRLDILSEVSAERFNIEATFKRLCSYLQKGEASFDLLVRSRSPLSHNKIVMLSAVSCDNTCFQKFDEVIVRDKDFFLKAVSLNGKVLQYASRYGFHLDRDVVLAAVAQKGDAIQYADDSLRFDKDIVLAAVAQDGSALRFFQGHRFCQDKEMVWKAVSTNREALKYAHKDLRRNKEFVLAAISQMNCFLSHAHKDLKSDKEVVLAAVSKWGHNLFFANVKFLRDRDVVMAAVTQNGGSLYYAHEDLRHDKEIVLAAVTQTHLALEYVHEDLRGDKDVILTALSQAPDSDSIQKIKRAISRASLFKDKDIQSFLNAV